jgi:hypothetical protein
VIQRSGAACEVPQALNAVACRMLNRADRIDLGQSDPVEAEGFSLGVVEKVLENFERDGEWVGSNNLVY